MPRAARFPLDTKVLYNDIGVGYEVNRFTFGFDVAHTRANGQPCPTVLGTWCTDSRSAQCT